jgi:hypothetical protein
VDDPFALWLGEVNLYRERSHSFDDACVDIADPVDSRGRIEYVRVDKRNTGGGLLDPPVELDAGTGVLLRLENTVRGFRAR